MMASRNGSHHSDAHKFDQFLKKLETTKQVKVRPLSSSTNEPRHRADSSDNSTFDSRNESAFNDYVDDDDDHQNERQLFETRQSFVDRRAAGSPCQGQGSVDSFIEKAQSGHTSSPPQTPQQQQPQFIGEELQLLNRNSDSEFFGEYEGREASKGDNCQSECLLKLDRRDAIPTPRHKNDVLLEIEASTVDRRDFMVRPGVRCTESLPHGITTTGMDCIGRVVQLTTHARAIFGISIDDRVAALYPFEYNDGYKDKGRTGQNKRYVLVDATYVVIVPKNVDAAEASCMVRLYLSAFQSIQSGISSLHDRYDLNQLKGQSILVQNGQTELGRALIELASLLGSSQIFATGPTENHSLLKELGAIPLGSETFGWELFLEEKISIVLVQDMPTPENFEQFIGILDETKGNMVYIHHGHSHIDEDDLRIDADDVSCDQCDGLHFSDISRKAKELFNSAKFSLRLSCSPAYVVYEGVWPSSKGNQSQFKEDLRFLLTLLSRGGLKPKVNECIGLEDIADVQDRIEVLGKRGTIVCLPTALYEKKASIVSPQKFSIRDPLGFPVESGTNVPPRNDPLGLYASDAGYVKTTPVDTLSDFHYMRDTKMHTPTNGGNNLLPALPESSSYSHSNFTHRMNPGSPGSRGGYHSETKYGSRSPQEHYHNETSSVISSLDYNSTANASSGPTALSDGAIERLSPFNQVDPPQSIQFRNKQTRRYRALRMRAKERRKKSEQHKTIANEQQIQDQTPLPSPESPNLNKLTSPPTQSTRKSRREARKRVQLRSVKNVADETPQSEAIGSESEHSGASALSVNLIEANSIAGHEGAIESTETRSFNPDKLFSAAGSRLVSKPSHGTHLEMMEIQDSRNEYNECARDISANKSSFDTVMNKWKEIEITSRVVP